MYLFKKIATLFAALVMVFGLASCDKSGNVKKAFEKEGYTITVVNADNTIVNSVLKMFLNEEQMKEAANYEIMLATKGLSSQAAIIKFPSSKDVKTFFTVEDSEGKKDTTNYDKAKEDNTINGNCVIFTMSSEAKDIFKKA